MVYQWLGSTASIRPDADPAFGPYCIFDPVTGVVPLHPGKMGVSQCRFAVGVFLRRGGICLGMQDAGVKVHMSSAWSPLHRDTLASTASIRPDDPAFGPNCIFDPVTGVVHTQRELRCYIYIYII